MTRVACKFEDGALWWRGSNAEFVWKHPNDLWLLEQAFAADPEPYAQDYARQIRRALAEYAENASIPEGARDVVYA